MRPHAARMLLACHLDDPNGQTPPAVQKALAALGSSPDLRADYEEQVLLDTRAAALLKNIDVPEETLKGFAEQVASIPVRPFNPRDPAIVAVIIGFILLVVVLTWNFLRPATFPPDALEIAEAVVQLDENPFEKVAMPAGDLEDWFVLKGFDGFRVPPSLAAIQADSAAIVKIGPHPMAIVGLPEKHACLVVFSAKPFQIDLAEGEWCAATLDEKYAAALGLEKGMCFLIIVEGNLAKAEKLADSERR